MRESQRRWRTCGHPVHDVIFNFSWSDQKWLAPPPQRPQEPSLYHQMTIYHTTAVVARRRFVHLQAESPSGSAPTFSDMTDRPHGSSCGTLVPTGSFVSVLPFWCDPEPSWVDFGSLDIGVGKFTVRCSYVGVWLWGQTAAIRCSGRRRRLTVVGEKHGKHVCNGPGLVALNPTLMGPPTETCLRRSVRARLNLLPELACAGVFGIHPLI